LMQHKLQTKVKLPFVYVRVDIITFTLVLETMDALKTGRLVPDRGKNHEQLTGQCRASLIPPRRNGPALWKGHSSAKMANAVSAVDLKMAAREKINLICNITRWVEHGCNSDNSVSTKKS
jgi:hypothetical protein